MLVLLPPSETKASGGRGRPLDLTTLGHPELNPVRERLLTALTDLAGDVPASLEVLGLSERQKDEVARNAELRTAPTMPALRRYTGVLYEALDVPSFTRATLAKASRRLVVASALFGLVGATDQIPAYRLSGDTVLPGVGSLRTAWKPSLPDALAAVDDLVVDLRSGSYAALATVPGAVSVRVVTEVTPGKRVVVSHFNKAAKGRLAGALAATRREPATIDALAKTINAAGFTVDQAGPRMLEILTDHLGR